MQRQPHHVIDPTNMTPEQADLLGGILRKLGPHGVLAQGYHEAHGFELTKALIGRERKLKSADHRERTPGFRFEVLDKASADSLLGKGGYGAVFVSQGTIQVPQDEEPALYKEKLGAKQRVIKIMTPDKETRITRTIREGFLNFASALHLRAKEPTVNYQGQNPIFYLVMRRMPGMAFVDQGDKILNLPFEARLKLAYLLLEAWHAQVASKGLAHFDIKAENIILDYDFDRQEVRHINFIDFGFSQDVSKGPVMPEGGTREFVAPEVVHNIGIRRISARRAMQSDVYSLAVLIAKILFPLHKMVDNVNYVRSDMYTLPYITTKRQESPLESEVREHLNGMLKHNAIDRPAFEQSLAFFNDKVLSLEPGVSPGGKY